MKLPNFALGDFDFQHVDIPSGHRCVTKKGFPFLQLRFIALGTCKNAETGEVYRTGDVLYIPAERAYELEWIEASSYYCLSIVQGVLPAGVNALCRITDKGLFDLGEPMKSAFDAGRTFAACSLFYAALSAAEPYVTRKESPAEGAVAPAMKKLVEDYLEPIKVEELARLCCLSESRFYVLFKKATGRSPIEYRNAFKIKKAIYMLREGMTVEEVAKSLGFCSPAFFRRQFQKYVGKVPSQM